MLAAWTKSSPRNPGLALDLRYSFSAVWYLFDICVVVCVGLYFQISTVIHNSSDFGGISEGSKPINSSHHTMHTCYSLSDALQCCSVYHFPPHHPAATILVERFELGKGLSQCEAQSRRTPGSVWFYIEYCQKGPLAKIVAFSKSHYKSGSSSRPGRGPPT